jgi:hypothetical protein
MAALDGSGGHSPFAEGILDNVSKPDLELNDVMRAVAAYVREKTDGRQTVWLENSLTKKFYFTNTPGGSLAELEPPEPTSEEGIIFPQSSEDLLTDGDLSGKDAGTLRLARNEIFARHGRIFNDAALKAHFEKFDWYHPTSYDVTLSDTEAKNVALIRQYELSDSAPKAGFLFVDSDRRLLTPEELEPLSKIELRNARNEIYARRGRKFVRKEVRDYFSQFDWYRPQFGEVELTYIENRNVALIKQYEQAK